MNGAGKSRVREDNYQSCLAIVRLISTIGTGSEARRLRRLLLEDLMWKVRELPPGSRSHVIAGAYEALAGDELRRVLGSWSSTSTIVKDQFDVAVVTVIGNELTPAQIAFGIDAGTPSDAIVHGYRYWHTKITDAAGNSLRVALTRIERAGNVECAIACARMFELYDIGLCILCGVAGGPEGGVQIGDVVAAELVIDYERAKNTPAGQLRRPIPYPVDLLTGRELSYFDPYQEHWLDLYRERLEELNRQHEIPDGARDSKPMYQTAVILAGEKLIADGTLQDEMRRQYHDRIRAAEMEGAGFARVCREYGVPWLEFRGIADFGTEESKRRFEEWQQVAALAAVTAAVTFVKAHHAPLRDAHRKEPS